MKKILLITGLINLTLINAQLYTPNGNISGSTTNPLLGNVGIGVTNPSEKLEVLETIALKAYNYQTLQQDKKWIFGTRGDSKGLFIAPQLANNQGWDWPKQVSFDGEGNVFISGNLAINRSNPIYRLDVGGNFRAGSETDFFAYNGADISLKYSSRGNNGQARALVHDDGNILTINYDGDFKGGTKIGNNIAFFNNSGKVGIGVPIPSERLDVLETIALSAVNYQANNRIDKKWVFSTRGDGTAMYLAPRRSDDSNWDWPKQIIFKDGNIAVSGKLEATEVKVTQSPTADFVFEENYSLPKLEDVEKHIKSNRHLPDIASAKEMEKEGVNVGEFQIKLLQKIEELTLYSIEQNKQLKIQAGEIENLKKELSIQKHK